MSVTVESASATVTQEIIDYCNSVGIDYEQYISDLDGTASTIDIDDELLMAYYQYAFVQMYQLIYGEELYAGEGAVGEPDYDTLISSMSSDDIAVINQIIQDDPELMAYFAYQAGGQSESDAVMEILSSLSGSGSSAGGSSAEEDGVSVDGSLGEMVDAAYDTQNTTNASLTAIFAYMDELNQATFALTEDLNGLSADDEAGILSIQTQIDMQSASMQMALTMVQQLSDQSTTAFSLLSAMIKNQLESQQALTNNFKVSA